jgi:hypothetical protein
MGMTKMTEEIERNEGKRVEEKAEKAIALPDFRAEEYVGAKSSKAVGTTTPKRGGL